MLKSMTGYGSAQGASGKEKYIAAATLNGQTMDKPILSHAQLMSGGEMTLCMSLHPNKALWA